MFTNLANSVSTVKINFYFSYPYLMLKNDHTLKILWLKTPQDF